MAAKDFSRIEDDYLFFMQSSTEAEADRTAHLATLRANFTANDSVHYLDFGCGAGHFTESLLSQWGHEPAALTCTLVEPVARHLHEAAERVRDFSHHEVLTCTEIDDIAFGSYDLLLANHSCYYVECATTVARRLTAALRPGGTGILAIAGNDNFLIQMWQTGFAACGMSVPWWVAEDYRSVLNETCVSVQRRDVPYQILFSDTAEQRMKLLRFLFADHLPQLDLTILMQQLDRVSNNGMVDIRTSSQHLVFRV